jgi:hypothetical protein
MNDKTSKNAGKKPKKYTEKYFPCTSDKNTPPYNDVVRVIINPKTNIKEFILVKGLTEEQKINEGSRPQYQYQLEQITAKEVNQETGIEENVVVRTIGRFEKTEFEREQLYGKNGKGGVHTNKPHPGKWVATSTSSHRGLLIIHLKNKRGKDYNKFKTTHSFTDVAANEVLTLLNSIIKLNSNKADDTVMNHVVKYFHLGETHYGKTS